ncbi:MAG TPA: DNA topoisomerase VI subunit B [archaeon]|nr:DNA topoisomerase VI subunit B [archaeon]HPV65995.1 DNA topoisomerase VI subunit B [archaeon]
MAEKAQDKKETQRKEVEAEQLFTEFKEHSVADFFKKNKQMLGLSGKQRSMTTIVHELVTNSLDACEEAGILPEIEVSISELGTEYYEISVIDNGPGIPEDKLASAMGKLLAGTKFHRLVQTRGQQGIGVSGIILLSQMTTGKPTKLISGTNKGKTVSMEMLIDSKTNTPKVANKHYLDNKYRGLAVKCKFKDIIYKKGQSSVDEYLRRTAIANPHLTISFQDPLGEKTTYTRTVNKLPSIPKAVKPHPIGVTVDEMLTYARHSTGSRKVNSFLMTTFDRFGQTSVDNVQKLVHFDLNKDPRALSWEEAEDLVKAIKQTKFIAPSTDNLVPIGEEQIKKSLKSIVEPEFLSVVTRKPTVYQGGYAFQIEAAVAYGGKAGRLVSVEKIVDKKQTRIEEVRSSEIIRYANKAPLLFDAGGCAITKTAESIDWKRYGISNFDTSPITIFVNLISVHIPYTSAGKSAVSDDPDIVNEIKLALMEVARKVGTYIIDKKREEEKKEKKKVFAKYAPYVVDAIVHTTGEKDRDLLLKNLNNMVLEKLKMEEEGIKIADDEIAEEEEIIDDEYEE